MLWLKPLVNTHGPLASVPSWVALPPATFTAHTRLAVSTTRSVSARSGSKAQPIALRPSSPVARRMSTTFGLPVASE